MDDLKSNIYRFFITQGKGSSDDVIVGKHLHSISFVTIIDKMFYICLKSVLSFINSLQFLAKTIDILPGGNPINEI